MASSLLLASMLVVGLTQTLLVSAAPAVAVQKQVGYVYTTIKLLDYLNPSNTLANGKKCDPAVFGFQKCDPYFIVTYRHGDTQHSVTYKQSAWEDLDAVVFQDGEAYSFTSPAGQPFSVHIRALDEDVGNDDIIGDFDFSTSAYYGNSQTLVATNGQAAIMRVSVKTEQF